MKAPVKLLMAALVIMGLVMSACTSATSSPEATPTTDPDIYNQMPTTTVFEPGQCTIVLDSAAQIQPDLAQFGVTTPYLLDDGTVSKAYNTLGKGMHAGLPGHGFVLIDKDGNKVWEGNYPSMWLDPQELLAEVTTRLQ